MKSKVLFLTILSLQTVSLLADVYYQTSFEVNQGYPVGNSGVTVIGNDGWQSAQSSLNSYFQVSTTSPISGFQSAALSAPMVTYSNPTFYRTFTAESPDVAYLSMDVDLNNVNFRNDAGTYRGVHLYMLNGNGVTSNYATTQVDITYTAVYGNGIFARNGASQQFIQAANNNTPFNITMELFLTGVNADKWNLYIDGVQVNTSLLSVRNSAAGKVGGLLIVSEGNSMPSASSQIFMDNIYIANTMIPEPATSLVCIFGGVFLGLRKKI